MNALAIAFDWSFVTDNGDELLAGLRRTLEVSAIAIAGAFVIGLVLGAARAHRVPVISQLAAIYVEIIRNTPILVTLFLVFFLLPVLNQQLEFSALVSASIALTLWGSAQVAEATRGAVQSIPKEQHEAASALGFGWIGRHAFVILPQALRRLLPPLVSLLVNIIQNSTIAQVIGAPELLESAERQVERLAAPPPTASPSADPGSRTRTGAAATAWAPSTMRPRRAIIVTTGSSKLESQTSPLSALVRSRATGAPPTTRTSFVARSTRATVRSSTFATQIAFAVEAIRSGPRPTLVDETTRFVAGSISTRLFGRTSGAAATDASGGSFRSAKTASTTASTAAIPTTVAAVRRPGDCVRSESERSGSVASAGS